MTGAVRAGSEEADHGTNDGQEHDEEDDGESGPGEDDDDAGHRVAIVAPLVPAVGGGGRPAVAIAVRIGRAGHAKTAEVLAHDLVLDDARFDGGVVGAARLGLRKCGKGAVEEFGVLFGGGALGRVAAVGVEPLHGVAIGAGDLGPGGSVGHAEELVIVQLGGRARGSGRLSVGVA